MNFLCLRMIYNAVGVQEILIVFRILIILYILHILCVLCVYDLLYILLSFLQAVDPWNVCMYVTMSVLPS